MIELLVALLLISIVFLGVEKLLLYNCTLEQQTEWIYQATLSGRNGLTSYPLSREVVLEKPDKDIFLEKSDLVKSQAWLAETFPNSKIVLEKAGKKIKVRCLPPPGSQFKIIELEE